MTDFEKLNQLVHDLSEVLAYMRDQLQTIQQTPFYRFIKRRSAKTNLLTSTAVFCFQWVEYTQLLAAIHQARSQSKEEMMSDGTA